MRQEGEGTADASDGRADKWVEFLEALPGPLATKSHVEAYAAHPKTRAALEKPKAEALRKP